MTQRREWGSRPIDGRDWGGSVAFDVALMAELVQRFEEACRGDDPTEKAFDDPFDDITYSSSRLFDDLEIEKSDTFDEEDTILVHDRKERERSSRRRQSSINKRRRLSIFAVAAGARSRHPRESRSTVFQNEPVFEEPEVVTDNPAESVGTTEHIMATIFSFMGEKDLLTVFSTVGTQWADWATDAHANLLVSSVRFPDTGDDDDENLAFVGNQRDPVLERSWKSLHGKFPWACYLAAGGAKTVYRAFNMAVGREEAISVMLVMRDIYEFSTSPSRVSLVCLSILRAAGILKPLKASRLSPMSLLSLHC